MPHKEFYILGLKRIRTFCLIVSIFMVSSCATLGLIPNAEEEFNQGLALFNRGQYREAIFHFEKATQLDPNYGVAYLYLGRSYLNLGEWLNAISPLRTALRLSPAESKKQVIDILFDAFLGAASHEFRKGNFQKSIAFLKEAIELRPQSEKAKKDLFSALLAYGGKLLSEGNALDAIDVFSEAVGLFPHDVNAYLGLARAFLKNGDLGKALKVTRDALRIDPRNKDLSLLLRELVK